MFYLQDPQILINQLREITGIQDLTILSEALKVRL